MVGKDDSSNTDGTRVGWFGLRVGGRLVPFYIHQMKQVNCCNGYAVMTAP